MLAGFLWKIPTALTAAYPNKIVNIHPALLPKYGGKGMYGQFVHEAVINAKERESGITIHYVDDAYDHGSTIFQATCPVLSEDTPDELAKRIQEKTIGVWFAADDDILKHLDVIKAGKSIWPLVGADFPVFRDGRSFSTAALLRERFHWTGEIRAIGDVLIDQLILGARSGFDSFALRADQNTDVALKQFNLFTVTTQNSWRDCRSQLSNQLTEAV